jgi:hypothetical protein
MPTATDSPPRRRTGTVLLLHFSQPIAGARHFVDHAVDVTARLARLRAGVGPPLIRAAVAAGVDLEVAPLRVRPARPWCARPCGESWPRPARRLLRIAVSGLAHAPQRWRHPRFQEAAARGGAYAAPPPKPEVSIL